MINNTRSNQWLGGVLQAAVTVTVIRFILLASNLPMAMAFSFVDCYCDHAVKVYKWHTGVFTIAFTCRGFTQRLA